VKRAAAAGALLLCVLLLCAAAKGVLARELAPMRALAEDCRAAPDAAQALRILGELGARWERFEPIAAILTGRGQTGEVRRAIAALTARAAAGQPPADWAGDAAALCERLRDLR